MNKKMKTVEDFASRDYPVLLHKDNEGDYIAEIPDLPGCMTDAKTREDALREIEDAKRTWIAIALENGVDVPEPRNLDEEPSGKLLLRLPKSLHRSLRWEAEREGISMNQCVVFMLTKAMGVRALERIQEQTEQVLWNTFLVRLDFVNPSQSHVWGTRAFARHEPQVTYGAGLCDVWSSWNSLRFGSSEPARPVDLTMTVKQLIRSEPPGEACWLGESK